MRHEITIGRVFVGLLVLVASAASFSLAMVTFVEGHDWATVPYVVAGICLGVWAGLDLTERTDQAPG
jgi:hypothetical protein